MEFEFVDEKENKTYNARIKVAGVGGGGGNAVNSMINSKLRGVDFIVANTDAKDLDASSCSHRIQLGPSITMGLGAGADPEIGKLSAEESNNEIKMAVDNSDMVFIAAGMGGGTGTGASPEIARQCKEIGALTVAVVTKPFKFEGEKRMKRALEGIEVLRKEVDSLIVIPNERLKTFGNGVITFKELLARADEVLLDAVKGISDLIMSDGFISLDFADVKKVMEQVGSAIMGMGRANGENRTSEAAQKAITSPLLEDISIGSAKGLLMNITGPSDMTMDEIDEACNYIRNEVNEDADIFWGVVFDDGIENEVQVTIVATGIDDEDDYTRDFSDISDIEKAGPDRYSNVINIRSITPEESQESWTVKMNGVTLDTPTYQRKGMGLSVSPKEDEKKRKRKGLLGRLGIGDNLDIPTFRRLGLD
ncbi:MAG: cell division protein FtsZ [Desulfobacterales bacterium]|nr:cell division protein FtsZ [Desulfobacterales bacterium]